MKRMGWVGALAGFLILRAMVSHAASDLKAVKMVIPRGSTFVLSYYAARDAGIFRKHGIDVEVDARPFAGFMSALPNLAEATSLGRVDFSPLGVSPDCHTGRTVVCLTTRMMRVDR